LLTVLFNSVVLCLFNCVIPLVCIVCVKMSTVLRPPGVNPIAVNKYVVSYIVSYRIVIMSHVTCHMSYVMSYQYQSRFEQDISNEPQCIGG